MFWSQVLVVVSLQALVCSALDSEMYNSNGSVSDKNASVLPSETCCSQVPIFMDQYSSNTPLDGISQIPTSFSDFYEPKSGFRRKSASRYFTQQSSPNLEHCHSTIPPSPTTTISPSTQSPDEFSHTLYVKHDLSPRLAKLLIAPKVTITAKAFIPTSTLTETNTITKTFAKTATITAVSSVTFLHTISESTTKFIQTPVYVQQYVPTIAQAQVPQYQAQVPQYQAQVPQYQEQKSYIPQQYSFSSSPNYPTSNNAQQGTTLIYPDLSRFQSQPQGSISSQVSSFAPATSQGQKTLQQPQSQTAQSTGQFIYKSSNDGQRLFNQLTGA